MSAFESLLKSSHSFQGPPFPDPTFLEGSSQLSVLPPSKQDFRQIGLKKSFITACNSSLAMSRLIIQRKTMTDAHSLIGHWRDHCQSICNAEPHFFQETWAFTSVVGRVFYIRVTFVFESC